MLKLRTITQFLEHYDWYLKLRFSILHDLNLKIRYPKRYKSIQKENQLYIQLLQSLPTKNPLIFDIGANIGQLTNAFLAAGAKEVIAVEPDPNNYRILKARFGGHPRIKLIEKAVSNQITQLPFYQQENGGALSTLNQKWKDLLNSKAMNRSFGNIIFHKKPTTVETTTLDQLIQLYGVPDLIKIDVEGHELEVLQGLSQAVPLLSFEANLPEFLEETIGCVEILYSLSDKVTFQYSFSDNFQLSPSMDASSLINTLKTTNLKYMDIFCALIT